MALYYAEWISYEFVVLLNLHKTMAEDIGKPII